jgi:hypothetical protein
MRAIATAIAAASLVALGSVSATPGAAPAAAVAALPMAGCPMAHCDPQMTDLVKIPAPAGNVGVVWHRRESPGEIAGSRLGLGCSGNAQIVACTFNGAADNLAVYDYAGVRRWTSGTLLTDKAYTSAPVVLANGDILAADDTQLVRFSPTGGIVWQAALVDGGTPISTVPMGNGVILVGTYGGPLYTFDDTTGALLGTLFVRRSPDDAGFFETINTPAAAGARAYVAMHHQTAGVPDPDHRAWLVAVDVDRASAEPMTMAWHFEFGGPSGASPLLINRTIYFDGDRAAPGAPKDPHIFAVADAGGAPAEIWRRRVAGSVVASFARDPRPGAGLWTYSLLSPWLLRRSSATGAVLQAVNVDELVADAGRHVPLSAMSIASPWWQPTMLLIATAFNGGSTAALAVDLGSSTLRWKVTLADYDGGFAGGQFPILVGAGGPRVVFSSYGSGVRAIGAP